MRRTAARWALLVWLVAGLATAAADGRVERVGHEAGHRPALVADYFRVDPRDRWDAVAAGAVADRVSYEFSEPLWPGDRPGSLRGRYDSSAPAALFGLSLPETLVETDDFTAAAVFVIEPEGFAADPNGFFQLSWGLWNRRTTGLNRTGNFSSFAADTFETLEFDYFPNVSPFFGGPFFSPSIFGEADPASPNFPLQGAFANSGFAFGVETELPFGAPLLAVIEHKAALGVAVFSVHRIVAPRATVPVPGAVTVIELEGLPLRRYALDAVGLMLWNDGFAGPIPALVAEVEFHGLIVTRGFFRTADEILRVPPRQP